ncbi:LacI family DNA-binding transcriptional regulator [Amycolatopsis tolypomycina]|uniref:DNA-binding transcriptional regulator, LacI/PurR family n=1 Tax=Amycolatopsis tolypomycina TaxID=208445 RepID=A0A1H4SR32_9PSEU|nr:LacI family DNA-binding transcriptional regulator [Amycolatopsis tolypomycina]SEC46434.1 DNA-binding transcriptional regulator, LacI/PurR family [Amycolatopsis tolypomycina]
MSGHGEQRKVSIRDVARVAGVSHQTVSRVINGHPRVTGDTRERVNHAIAELGFRPSRVATALAGGQVKAVTVLVSDTALYGYGAALQGIEAAAREAGYAVGVCALASVAPENLAATVARVGDPSAGALLVIAWDQVGIQALHAVPPGVAVVALAEASATPPAPPCPTIRLDDGAAAAHATRYLLELGHRTVHHVAIPSSSGRSDRIRGWRQALADAGVTAPEPVQASWTPRSGYEAGRALAAGADVTAVLCGNDDLALGVVRALHEAGRRVPDDVSVVGFDDVPQAAYYTPALTTVRQDFAGLGRDGFALLHEVLAPAARRRPLTARKPELIIRESSGPPKRP